MRKSLFLRIVDAVQARNSYFVQKKNASGQKGFTAIHKCLVAMRMLAYGGSADALDDTYTRETLIEFVETVRRCLVVSCMNGLVRNNLRIVHLQSPTIVEQPR